MSNPSSCPINRKITSQNERHSRIQNNITTHQPYVLSDGTTAYLYGIGRIGEQGAGGWQYPLGDALGSVRQLTDPGGYVKLVKTYEPFGSVLSSTGDTSTNYGFTGEWTDGYIKLIYLRSRYYAPWQGRFISQDVWEGDYSRPLSLNGWTYVEGNPINHTDPSGMCLVVGMDGECAPGWQCTLISDPIAREACWQAFCEKPIVEPPGGNCNADCMDAYNTYVEVVKQLGKEPFIEDILYMTAANEYFNVVDMPYYNDKGYHPNPAAENFPEPTARSTGREALARAFYHFCGRGAKDCKGTGLYRFLSGYEPWCGYKGADYGDPVERASDLLNGTNLYGTGSMLRTDVTAILLPSDTSWWEGAEADEPWQWFTEGARFSLERDTFGYSSSKNAILAVDTGGGKYLWMFTYIQSIERGSR